MQGCTGNSSPALLARPFAAQGEKAADSPSPDDPMDLNLLAMILALFALLGWAALGWVFG